MLGRCEARRARRWGLLLAAAAMLLCLALVYVVAVRTSVGQTFDDRALDGWRVSHPRIGRLSAGLLDSADLVAACAVSAAAVAILLWRRSVARAVAVVAVVAGSVATAEVLKGVLLSRPALADDDPVLGLNTFPSGHATVAMALAAVLIIATPARLRGVVAPAAVTWAAGVGMAALYLGWHRPSDVVGGYLCAAAWVFAAAAVWPAGDAGARPPRSGGRQAATRPILGALLVAAAAVAVVALAAGLARHRDVDAGAVALTRGFWAGTALVVAAAAVVGRLVVVAVTDPGPPAPTRQATPNAATLATPPVQ